MKITKEKRSKTVEWYMLGRTTIVATSTENRFWTVGNGTYVFPADSVRGGPYWLLL